jgi:hypothetical protein
MDATLQVLLMIIIAAVFIAALIASRLWLRRHPNANKARYRLLGVTEWGLAIVFVSFALNEFRHPSEDWPGSLLWVLVIALVEWERRKLRDRIQEGPGQHGT